MAEMLGLIEDVPSFFQSDEDVLMFADTEGRLDSLPHLQHRAEYFTSLKVYMNTSICLPLSYYSTLVSSGCFIRGDASSSSNR